MTFITRLDTAELDMLITKLDLQSPEIIEAVAYDVEGKAKMNAPVDTGFLRNSIEAEEQTKTVWRVNVWAEYGIYVELGTSRMAAQPYLVPAIEAAYNAYTQAWREFFI